ncbi:MAG: hypothetical protein RJA34_2154 [Pseudomonadota bacterium]|jgi:hypothetical protein
MKTYVICLALWTFLQTSWATNTAHWRCEVAYLPQRSTWMREVAVDYNRKAVTAVRIDGLAPYAYSVQGTVLLTAIDNERIQLDLGQRVWRSNFRESATGEGRCSPSDE